MQIKIIDPLGNETIYTDEHASTSYNQYAKIVNGKLQDGIYTICTDYDDMDPWRGIVDQLADRANIHDGPATRSDLHKLADKLLPDNPVGSDYDMVINTFKRNGAINDKKEYVQNLVQWLMDDGYTQTQIAKECGVDFVGTVSRWKNGHTIPSDSVVKTLENMLKK